MAIERVCVVGAGVIGSLYAGHLTHVAEVSVLTRRGDQARKLGEAGLRISGKSEFTANGLRDRRSRRAARRRPRHRRDQGDPARGRRRCARRPVPQGDRDDDPERPRRRGARPHARRLAADLRGDVHVGRPPRRRARRVRARHRDLARALCRDGDLRAGAGDRGAARGGRPPRARVPRPAARAVVEADLQRDREHRRGADEPAARERVRGAARRTSTSATSSTT